jgi:hypothetical protein
MSAVGCYYKGGGRDAAGWLGENRLSAIGYWLSAKGNRNEATGYQLPAASKAKATAKHDTDYTDVTDCTGSERSLGAIEQLLSY